MQLTVTIDSSNDAFTADTAPSVLASNLRAIAVALTDGRTDGTIRDPNNGGRVGEWTYTPEPAGEFRTVTIPACEDHGGWDSIKLTLAWACPTCGEPRGEPFRTTSYDGSRRLTCDGWDNPCGHVDYYDALRRETDFAGATR